ncbi:MAG TPA: vitamin K epoxide reductase family protein [Candidatus Saccharimonadales bacterium]|nr:vitamin K epoxide reductase family protein [Candidatus Saccharimonadales bacterium]
MKKLTKNWTLEKALPWLLLVGGVIGVICSLVLTYDQIKIWVNPHYVPVCNLNPIVNCASVINSNEGHILGIPGPFFGLLAFPVLATLGVVLLSGAKLKRWIWVGLEGGAIGGVVFALWLFWLSLYRIHALCPFCLTVDVVIYTLFWYITLYNLRAGHIRMPTALKSVERFMFKYQFDLLLLWLLILAGITLKHFWYFYGPKLGF